VLDPDGPIREADYTVENVGFRCEGDE
jgi:hypothetical protein